MLRPPVLAAFCTLTLLANATGSRSLLEGGQAPSPAEGGSARSNKADVNFFLTADQALFTTASTLLLQSPAQTVAMFQDGAGVMGETVAAFASRTVGARFLDAQGRWLGQPQALLQGTANSTLSDVLLTLSQPVYDNTADTLQFTVAVVPPQPAAAKFSGGVVSRRIQQYEAGAGPFLIQDIEPGMELMDAALFIDQSHDAMQKPAELKFGWGGSDNSINFGTGTSPAPPSGR